MKRKKSAAVFIVLLLLIVLSAIIFADNIKEFFYPREYSYYVEKYAKEYNVPEPLVYSVIRAESNFDSNAVSSVGAVGLMQIMPDTFDWLGRVMETSIPNEDIRDPETNIKYGTYYLSHLYKRFGSWETAVAAYNAGHGRVESWLGDSKYSENGVDLKEIPIKETDNYVNKVRKNYKMYKEIYYNDGE